MNDKVELSIEQKKKFARLFEQKGSFIKYLACTFVPEIIIMLAIFDINEKGMELAKQGDYLRIIFMIGIIVVSLVVFVKLYMTVRMFGTGDSSAFVRHKLVAVEISNADLRIENKRDVNSEEFDIYYTVDGKEYKAENILLNTKELIQNGGESLVVVMHKENKWEVAKQLFDIRSECK